MVFNVAKFQSAMCDWNQYFLTRVNWFLLYRRNAVSRGFCTTGQIWGLLFCKLLLPLQSQLILHINCFSKIACCITKLSALFPERTLECNKRYFESPEERNEDSTHATFLEKDIGVVTPLALQYDNEKQGILCVGCRGIHWARWVPSTSSYRHLLIRGKYLVRCTENLTAPAVLYPFLPPARSPPSSTSHFQIFLWKVENCTVIGKTIIVFLKIFTNTNRGGDDMVKTLLVKWHRGSTPIIHMFVKLGNHGTRIW